MILPINKEIKNYKQKVFFGLTVRRFIFLVIAILVGVITYFSIRDYVSFEAQTWIIGGAVIPIALLGFLDVQGMHLEKFLLIFFRNKILIRKHIVFKSTTLYREIEKEYEKREKKKMNEKDNKNTQGVEEPEKMTTNKVTFLSFLKKYRFAVIVVVAVISLIIMNKSGIFSLGKNGSEEIVSGEQQLGDEPYITVDNNDPGILKTMNLAKPFISINSLDDLGRVTGATAYIGKENIDQKKEKENKKEFPTGFNQAYYYELVDEKSEGELYKVGNLIPFVDSSIKNSITETKFMYENIQPYFAKIRTAISKDKHVVISAIPKFNGDDLLCESLQLQAYSVEDNGESISFNVIFRNIQPGIKIDYSTGDSIKE